MMYALFPCILWSAEVEISAADLNQGIYPIYNPGDTIRVTGDDPIESGWDVIGALQSPYSLIVNDATSSIKDFLFQKNPFILAVTAAEVTTVGDGLFLSSSNLKSISFSRAAKIGIGAFEDCVSLTDVSLPQATEIGGSAFSGCTALQSVSLPEAFHIWDGAFSECTGLSDISLPKARSIGSFVFMDCSALRHLILHDRAPSLGTNVFLGGPENPITVYTVPDASPQDYTPENHWPEDLILNPYAPVAGIDLTPAKLDLAVGETAVLTCKISPSYATNKQVAWKSSDETIATVDKNGNVEAVGHGACTITVTTAEGARTAACEVTSTASILIPVTGITIDPTRLTLKPGATSMLTATVLPPNATVKNISWSSTYPDIATVESGGIVTARSAGTAVITARSNDGDWTATCAVTVAETVIFIDLSDLELQNGILYLEAGQEIDAAITATPEGTYLNVADLPQGLTLTTDGHLYGQAPPAGIYSPSVTAVAPDGTTKMVWIIMQVENGRPSAGDEGGGGSGSGCRTGFPAALPFFLLFPLLQRFGKRRRKQG